MKHGNGWKCKNPLLSYSYNLICQSISIHMLIFPPVGKEGPGSEISMFQDADGEKGL